MNFLRKAKYPMPVNGLLALDRMSSAPLAMLMRLSLFFWVNNCEELPTRQSDLRYICGAHEGTWVKWRERVLMAFREKIKPELVEYYELRERKGTTISFVSARGVATRTKVRQQSATERQRAAGVVLPTPKRKAANQAALVEARDGETGFID
jgi:hypothetical protein